MANLVNNWIKTALTTISDSYLFLVSQTTGETKPISWASIKGLIKTYMQGENLTFTGTLNVKVATTTTEPTQKAYVDTLDGANVKKTGAQTVAGIKTFSDQPLLPATGVRFTRGAAPSSSSDPTGNTNELRTDGTDLYLKNDAGVWKKIGLSNI